MTPSCRHDRHSRHSPHALGLLDGRDGLPAQPSSLCFDLEGKNLSRHGSISILQLHVLPSNRTYLVDVHTLRDRTFSTCGTNGHTLKEMLESDAIPKVFFDVQNGSDALYSHCNHPSDVS